MAKILLVEDDVTLQEMYCLKIEKEGFVCVCANDGEDGLKKVKQEKPDLILLDIIMPRLDGFGVLQKLKEQSATKDIPVVLLTNVSQPKDRERGAALGAVSYIVKADSTPAQVVDEVRRVLGISK